MAIQPHVPGAVPLAARHARVAGCALLVALLALLTGCELDLSSSSSSDDGTRVVLSSTNITQITTSSESDGSRIRFSSTGL